MSSRLEGGAKYLDMHFHQLTILGKSLFKFLSRWSPCSLEINTTAAGYFTQVLRQYFTPESLFRTNYLENLIKLHLCGIYLTCFRKKYVVRIEILLFRTSQKYRYSGSNSRGRAYTLCRHFVSSSIVMTC